MSLTDSSVNFYNPLPQNEDHRPIIPKFWTGKSAIPFEDFQIDCSKFQMHKIVQKITMNDELNQKSITEAIIDHDFPETKALADEMSDKFNSLNIFS